MSDQQQQTIDAWIGHDMVDQDGDKIGKVEEIYSDDVSGQPEWFAVKTGLFGGKSNFVPVSGATADGDQLVVPFTKDHVKDAPKVDADGHLEPDEEDALYQHYGRTDYAAAPTADRGTETDDGTGHDVSGPDTDDAMTRSEEELAVGTRSQERGRARLRKYVVTENVTTTVPVRREEVRVEHEPIADANRDVATSGAPISEEEHEIVLNEEEVVVDKRVVPKERVRMDKDVVTEDREVSEDVQKEQIDVEGDAGQR